MKVGTKRVTDYLVADHERLSALMAEARAGGSFHPEPFAEFRAGLLRHIAIEEKLLLPAVRVARGGRPLDRVHQLQIEHAAITSLLVPRPDLSLCREILSLLEPHDAREEGPDGIYAECEEWLAEQSAELAAAAAAFPEVRVAPHRNLPGMHRTAAEAMASASRMRPRGSKPEQ